LCPGPTTPIALSQAAITDDRPGHRRLVRCYSNDLRTEYGDLESDYVFVNLSVGLVGTPLSYAESRVIRRLLRTLALSSLTQARLVDPRDKDDSDRPPVEPGRPARLFIRL
jgi:hypothetical protein